MKALRLEDRKRNDTYADWWSLSHVLWAALLVLVLPPFWALVVMVLWEPLEVLVLCRVAARFGIAFGHESLRNSLMDVVFDVAGVLLGAYLLVPLVEPLGLGVPLW